MPDLKDHFARSLIDWLFRRRSPALIVMRIGLTCLVLSFGAGWIFNVSFPFQGGAVALRVDSAGGTPTIIVYTVFILGVALVIGSFVWEIARYRKDQHGLTRKRVIVIETRGLRDTSGTPLIDAVPADIEGHRDQLLVDLRQRVKDGFIIQPEAALGRLASLPTDLERRETGLDRRDITNVYGGLTPVPFTFLTGVLMDDEGAVVVLDWDRHAENWRSLNGKDDGSRFRTEGLDSVVANSSEVALAVSVSYRVDLDGVRLRVGDMPLVHLDLEGGSPDCHWSEEKQRALGKQFLDTAVALGDIGTRRIHLFLAAQNSVVFRFGRLYDKRNLPELVVYQYQREETPPYPWGVFMPVSGNEQAGVV